MSSYLYGQSEPSPEFDPNLIQWIPILGEIQGVYRGSQVASWAYNHPDFQQAQYELRYWQDCSYGMCHYPETVMDIYGADNIYSGGAMPTSYVQSMYDTGAADVASNVNSLFMEVALGRIIGGVGYRNGREIKVNDNFRIAPFGNRTGHATGELPHYHWRPSNPPPKGQGWRRHQPWDVKDNDAHFLDRFFDYTNRFEK